MTTWPPTTAPVRARQALAWLGALLIALSTTGIRADLAEWHVHDLSELSLEELMNIEVTSVAKKPQRRAEVAAAVFVISAEDLRRQGVNNIPDALRMVPGLHVARLDANKWAITSRGFNGRFANKLLVMIDGRSVYTPLFAGVYWENQEVPIQDVERIEVIRGPGGTVWGANAVNGVINIITRDASDTQGTMIVAGAGNELRGESTVRHGGTLGENGHYRAYGRYVSRDNGYDEDDSTHDDWELGQAGFRSDWQFSRDHFTLQGDYQSGDAGQQVTLPDTPPPATKDRVGDTDLKGGNILFRWERDLDNGDGMSLQVYYDHVGRKGIVLYEDRDTFDIEFQHRLTVAKRHDVTWGLGYRYIEEDTKPTSTFSLSPDNRDVELFSAFLQDEIRMLDDTLALTIGTKVEHNDFSGYEYQPNVRLAWTPDERHTLWGAISRAVRTPARGEHDVTLQVVAPGDPPPPAPVFVVGDEDYDSEDLLAFELGYRQQVGERWAFDIAAFYNDYDSLRTYDGSPSGAGIVLPFENNMDGKSWGAEVATKWFVRSDWHLQATYSWLTVQTNLRNGSDSVAKDSRDSTPTHQASFWSSLDLPWRLEWDAGFRYVGSFNSPDPGVDDYFAVDTRLGWQASDELDLSIAVRNLFDDHHREGRPSFIETQSTEVERSFEARAVWNF